MLQNDQINVIDELSEHVSLLTTAEMADQLHISHGSTREVFIEGCTCMKAEQLMNQCRHCCLDIFKLF
jgi:hypothetical protein